MTAVLSVVLATGPLGSPCQAQTLDGSTGLQQSQSDASTEELPNPVPPPPEPDLDAAQRIYLGLEAEEKQDLVGLKVVGVTRDSPAWKAGFQEGDNIVGINGFSINNMNDMIEQLSKTRPGQSVTFLINRSGKNRELTAVLISLAMAQQILSQPATGQNEVAWVGLNVNDLTPGFRNQFGLAAYRGAAVSQVAPGSPAQRAGIRAGDAITEIDSRPIESAQDFNRWLETARPGDQVTLTVYRGIMRLQMQIVTAVEPRPQTAIPAFRPTPSRPPVRPPKPPSDSKRDQSDSDLSIPPPVDAQPTTEEQVRYAEQAAPTQRELELQAEVERLRAELTEAQSKLNDARQQLNSILRALRD